MSPGSRQWGAPWFEETGGMGAWCSSAEATNMGDRPRERDIKKSGEKKTLKLVLLGPEQSGKSTLMKQLLRIHNGALDSKTRREYIEAVNNDMLQNMVRLIEKSEHYGGKDASLMYDDKLTDDIKTMLDFIDNAAEGPIEEAIGKIITKIWTDPAVQKCHETISDPEYDLDDSATYFYENVQRICKTDFVPNMEDVIRVRWRTTGVYQETFTVEDHVFKLIDLGGQRSERRKWKSCFKDGDVNAVLFMVAISGFNVVCKEDPSMTQLEEAYELFKEFTKEYPPVATILILNKFDLFVNKIPKVDITDCPLLKDFKGDCRDIEETVAYIEQVFYQIHCSARWYCHFSTATDEAMVKHIFWDVKDTVLQNSLRKAGILIS
uniref:Uncharacterized protein n=1 Tax=Amorphochlora amoebiformis TaxID=1561963 RepID=A0A7S0H0P5_9EUKA|mmetsp:Transcript_25915/g.41046  ORF Transcript_25915/g.41046 Transcript_25915/m.41046 type:complete len:378 (+) Transcript_25915:2-1135(+)